MIKMSMQNADSVRRMIEAGGKQAAYAASRALNTIAFKVMREGQAHVQAQLDRPTPWTVKAWYVRKKASKTSLSAAVGWSDYLANKRGHAAEYYLAQHWEGGGRQFKAFESRLHRAGLMPAGMFAVPGKAASEMGFIDGRGNFKGSALVQILSGLGAFTESGYSANATVRTSRKIRGSKAAARHTYWSGKPGRNTPHGIWVIDEQYKRGRGRLRPVMVFVSSTRYGKRLDMQRIASTVTPQEFTEEFWREYQVALANAR